MKWIFRTSTRLDRLYKIVYHTHMDTTYSEQTAMEMLYQGKSLQGTRFSSELVNRFNSVCDELELNPLSTDVSYGTDFLIPDHYRELDITEYLLKKIPDSDPDHTQRVTRVQQELEIYKARNLLPVLQTLIYIVDTMRKNNIVWGVGRGSSVASYCLYLIGVHRIDSVRYDLDIREFFK